MAYFSSIVSRYSYKRDAYSLENYMKKIVIILFLICNFLCKSEYCYAVNNVKNNAASDKMYFATSADDKHYSLLLNLIGSIHRVHFDTVGEIAVFDLGLTQQQLRHLKKIAKLNVYDIEMTNPDLLKPVYTGTKMVKGWFAWKPVAIKQALDMFPYVLYVDSGAVILKPINDLFEHIKENGYFFKDCGHGIRWMTTQHVIDKFNLLSPEKKWILNDSTFGLEAGFQGLTRKMYTDYVMPIYELTRDLKNFQDDGTSSGGQGAGREDQTLFSVQARLLNLHIHQRAGASPYMLSVNSEKKLFYITYLPQDINQLTQIYQCRWQHTDNFTHHAHMKRNKAIQDYSEYIHYK